jgi:hypothetical protein
VKPVIYYSAGLFNISMITPIPYTRQPEANTTGSVKYEVSGLTKASRLDREMHIPMPLKNLSIRTILSIG